MGKKRLFQKGAVAVLLIYMSLMFFGAAYAYIRPRKSGRLAIDATAVQKMRFLSNRENEL